MGGMEAGSEGGKTGGARFVPPTHAHALIYSMACERRSAVCMLIARLLEIRGGSASGISRSGVPVCFASRTHAKRLDDPWLRASFNGRQNNSCWEFNE